LDLYKNVYVSTKKIFHADSTPVQDVPGSYSGVMQERCLLRWNQFLVSRG